MGRRGDLVEVEDEAVQEVLEEAPHEDALPAGGGGGRHPGARREASRRGSPGAASVTGRWPHCDCDSAGCAASYRDEHGGGVVRRHADAEAVADEPGDDRQPDGRYHVPAAAARERLALVRACSQVSVGVLRECVST